MFESVTQPQGANWKLRILLVGIGVILAYAIVSLLRMIAMPLHSYAGPLPALTSEEVEMQKRLATHVEYLSATIGERNLRRSGTLPATAQYLRSELEQLGYTVAEQKYSIGDQPVSNLEVILPGTDNVAGGIVVGAHYDTAESAPGANDNGTGVAAILELARLLHTIKLRKTVRLVLFTNEEPPYFQTEQMGSMVYARQLHHDHVSVAAMISVETIGFYSDQPASQKYPPSLNLFYSDLGNFIGFVGDSESRNLLRRSLRIFRESCQFPSDGIAAPENLPGIGWSDQWSFWQEHYPGIMITDTAVFRYPYYHTPQDTIDKVDFEKMARVTKGIEQVVVALASDPN